MPKKKIGQKFRFLLVLVGRFITYGPDNFNLIRIVGGCDIAAPPSLVEVSPFDDEGNAFAEVDE